MFACILWSNIDWFECDRSSNIVRYTHLRQFDSAGSWLIHSLFLSHYLNLIIPVLKSTAAFTGHSQQCLQIYSFKTYCNSAKQTEIFVFQDICIKHIHRFTLMNGKVQLYFVHFGELCSCFFFSLNMKLIWFSPDLLLLPQFVVVNKIALPLLICSQLTWF